MLDTLVLAISGLQIANGLIWVLFLGVSLLLILTILIQKPQGGGLAGAFGSGAGSGQTAFGAKTGDMLTIMTVSIFVLWLLGAIALNFWLKPATAATPPAAVAPASPAGAAPGAPTGTPPAGTAPNPAAPGATTPTPAANPGAAPQNPAPSTTPPTGVPAQPQPAAPSPTQPPTQAPAPAPATQPTTPPATPPSSEPGR